MSVMKGQAMEMEPSTRRKRRSTSASALVSRRIGVAVPVLMLLATTWMLLSSFPDQVPEYFGEFSCNTHESLASRHTGGFIVDVSDESWERTRLHARNFRQYSHSNKEDGYQRSELWYRDNLQPILTCPHAQRLSADGGLDDTGKWVCEPHRLAELPSCLIYSIGCNGEYGFEDMLAELLDRHCEIHVFDPNDYDRPENAERNIFFHQWGWKSSYHEQISANLMGSDKRVSGLVFKTFQDTLEELGHQNRLIEMFKIDCEGCEWSTYKDWIGGNIRQIQIEVHGVPSPLAPTQWTKFPMNVSDFYDAFTENNFAMFSKELNNWSKGDCIEYAFLKVTEDFWNDEASNSEAYRVSYGLLNDVSDESWARKKKRVKQSPFLSRNPRVMSDTRPPFWSMGNVLPNFSCTDMRRVGGHGDGPKWVCNPHRLATMDQCLIYSFSSDEGHSFEEALAVLTEGNCEIHIFDPLLEDTSNSPSVHDHAWGLNTSYTKDFSRKIVERKESVTLYSFDKIRSLLGHENRTIHLLHFDCEGCEWLSQREWMNSGARQILVESHSFPITNAYGPLVAAKYFSAFVENGYVLYSKEYTPGGHSTEWSYLKLSDEFWEDVRSM